MATGTTCVKPVATSPEPSICWVGLAAGSRLLAIAMLGWLNTALLLQRTTMRWIYRPASHPFCGSAGAACISSQSDSVAAAGALSFTRY